MLSLVIIRLTMNKYLSETFFIDCSNKSLKDVCKTIFSDELSDKENAISLYLYVRDSIKYDPYALTPNKSCFIASEVLKAGKGYCVSKVVLYVALLRSVNIPARLGFSDVVNHLSSEKLLENMGTNIFYYHGYAEVFLNGRWIKATPAFDSKLCEVAGIPPLEFDGENDSKFQKFNDSGNKYMEYLQDHGCFDDVPYELLLETYVKYYPALFKSCKNSSLDDLHLEIESDMKS